MCKLGQQLKCLIEFSMISFHYFCQIEQEARIQDKSRIRFHFTLLDLASINEIFALIFEPTPKVKMKFTQSSQAMSYFRSEPAAHSDFQELQQILEYGLGL